MHSSKSRFSRRTLRLEALESREVPAYFLVTGIGDDSGLTPTSGRGSAANPFHIDSLRSAIEQANLTAKVADTIRFDAELTGQTITLDIEGDPLTFSAKARTTVDGQDRSIKVDGAGTERYERVFEVNAGAAATIKNLTIQDGIDAFPSEGGQGGGSAAPADAGDPGGGGIRNAGNLILTSVIVTDNKSVSDFEGGGGIYNALGGKLTLSHSVVSGNVASNLGQYENYVPGGGITNKGTMTVTFTTVKDNSAAGYGGGINNAGTLVITNSTISTNSSQDPDNSESGSDGGGINNSGVLRMTNATVSGNYALASGGGINDTGTMTLLNCTITNNNASFGGGIRISVLETGEKVSLKNSIISANTVFGEEPSDLFGSIDERGPAVTSSVPAQTGDEGTTVSANYCLIGTFATVNLVGSGNQLNVNDPGLGPLQDNGGETFTHALLANSPAINRGSPSTQGLPFLDQRGGTFFRVRGGRVDIGAFELQVGRLPFNSVKALLAFLRGQRRYH